MNHSLKKTYDLGQIKKLPNGEDGVSVTFQCTRSFNECSRKQRKTYLIEQFKNIAKELHNNGLMFLDSISVSGQTVEGVLVLEKFEEIQNLLNNKKIRVDLLVDRNIV